MNFLLRLKDLFLDFLFPKSPAVLALESLTPEMLLQTLPPAQGPELNENTLALFDYSHTLVKEIIWEIKYGGNRVLAGKLGEVLFDVIIQELGERNILAKGPVILMPMPVSDRRRFERGWNQAELLSLGIKACDRNGVLKYLPRQLAKVRHTESQTRTANKSERLRNLSDSMRVVNPLSVADKFVVLIDDVITTGSTFSEAKRALKTAGVKKILCVAVAH